MSLGMRGRRALAKFRGPVGAAAGSLDFPAPGGPCCLLPAPGNAARLLLAVGSEAATSDPEVYGALAAATGPANSPDYAEERRGETRHSALNYRKAREALGWKDAERHRDGSRRAVECIPVRTHRGRLCPSDRSRNSTVGAAQ